MSYKANSNNIEYTRVNNDINGNPRYVIHFFEFLDVSELTVDNYELAHKRAKTLGGKIYRGKDFGGGFVFQSYNIQQLLKSVEKVANIAKEQEKDLLANL